MKYLLGIEIAILIAIWGLGAYLFWTPGSFSIQALPEGCQITLDGAVTANGAQGIKLRRGTHYIEIKKAGYATLKKAFEIKARDEINLNEKLIELPKVIDYLTGITTLDKGQKAAELLTGANNGRVFQKVQLGDGQKIVVSRVDFGQAVRVKWAPERFLVYVWRADGTSGMADLTRYDLINQKFESWGKGILDLAWTSDGKKVVYLYKPGTGEYSIIEASPGNEGLKRIYDLRQSKIANPYLEITPDTEIDKKEMVIFDKDIYIFNFYTHELKQLTKTGDVKLGRLSPDGTEIVYTTPSGFYKMTRAGVSKKIAAMPIARLTWFNGREALLGYSEGEFYEVNLEGDSKVLGYNGAKIGVPDEMIVGGDDKYVYLRIKNKVIKLFLQNIEVVK